MTPLTAAPSNPYNGLRVYADGVTWDPLTIGGTDGYWVTYNGTAWKSASKPSIADVKGLTAALAAKFDSTAVVTTIPTFTLSITTNSTSTVSYTGSPDPRPGQAIVATGIPASTTIVSVNTVAKTFVISNAATASGSVTGTFTPVAAPGATGYVQISISGANYYLPYY